jgi:hypothetical protein
MKALTLAVGGILLFIGIFAIIAVRVGAKAESETRRMLDKKE